MKKAGKMVCGGIFAAAQFASATGSLENSGCPNIILILADDLGTADVSCGVGTQISTPNIDSIAANGIRFPNAYVTAPQCGPSRAGIMTGRYQGRFGAEYNIPKRCAKNGVGLPLQEKTMADCMKELGYNTYAIGKWHLGSQEQFHPLNRGFDHFFGFLGGSSPYFPDPKTGFIPRILRDRTPVKETEYLTFALARETCAYIDQNRDRPFFIYAAFNAPHTPLQAPPEYLKKYENLAQIKSPPPHQHVTGRRQVYAAMVSALDDAVGQILQQLKASGVYDNTLIYFLSDNGAVDLYGGSNLPLHGNKGDLYEGGIRVPFMLQWPTRLKGGRVYESAVSSLDLLPTSVAAAGGIPDKVKADLDGKDLLPWLQGDKTASPHKMLCWRFLFRMDPAKRTLYTIRDGKTVYALRETPWKLVYNRDRGGLQLFDLSKDPYETKNLVAEFPEVAQRLQKQYEQWSSKLVKPAWPER